MEDAEINNLAARLEGVSSNGALVSFIKSDGKPHEDHLVANRVGYLCLAALFLRAAVAPYKRDESFIVDVEPAEVIDEDSDLFFWWMERRESISFVEQKSSLRQYLYIAGCAVLALCLCIVLAVGAATIFKWVF